MDEIDRIAANCEYNGKYLMNASITSDLKVQVGLYSGSDSQITLSSTLFASAKCSTLLSTITGADNTAKAATCTGSSAATQLNLLDTILNNISTRTTTLGAAQNRVDSAIESIGVQSENITSSLSTLRDADVSKESSKYIQSQILQQAAATLLSTANQTPSIALNLI